jgi:hypothetical protein
MEDKKKDNNPMSKKSNNLPIIKERRFNNNNGNDYKADKAYFVNAFKRCLIESRFYLYRFFDDQE